MVFETYTPRRGPGGGSATIWILNNGDISVGPNTHQEWFKGANYVELLYDPESGRIGLRPRKKPAKATYKLRTSPVGGDRRYVSAGQFLRHVGVKVGKAKSVETRWNANSRMAELVPR